MLIKLFRLRKLATLSRWLFCGGDVGEVTPQRYFKRHTLRAASLDIHTSHHFILGASRPILSVAFGAKGFSISRPSGFSDDGLPGAGRSFDECGQLKGSKAALYLFCTFGL